MGLLSYYFSLEKTVENSWGTFLLWAIGFTLSPVLFYGIERFCILMIK